LTELVGIKYGRPMPVLNGRETRDAGVHFRPPSLEGRHVHLRPLMPEDYGFLRILDGRAELSVRWRFRGSTPSPEEWVRSIWQAVLAQFLVVRADDKEPVGLVMAYKPNFQDKHAYLGATRFNVRERSPLLMLGAALFIEYVFTCWDFHKLYLELPEYNLVQFERGFDDLFVTEARLRSHVWYDGRLWDQVIMALYRDTWREQSARVLAAEAPRSDRPVKVHMPEADTSLQ
jgi:hypothetical protein